MTSDALLLRRRTRKLGRMPGVFGRLSQIVPIHSIVELFAADVPFEETLDLGAMLGRDHAAGLLPLSDGRASDAKVCSKHGCRNFLAPHRPIEGMFHG